MTEKKKIPCRVCGKLFEPCAYCQSHADVFRWRNFACSVECATKYVNDTITYRESIKNKNEKIASKIAVENETKSEDVVTTTMTTKKRSVKKNSTTVIKNNKTE